MKICLDYQPAVTQGAGIGRYTRVLVKELLKRKLPGDELCLFYLDFFRRAKVDVDGASVKPSRLMPGAVMQRLWRMCGFPPFDMLSGRADVFHFTNFLRPPLRRGRSVVTIFDMSFERFPQFAEAKNLRNLRRGIKETVKKADAIITISKFSSNEIAELLPDAVGKLYPIPLGISADFQRVSDEEIVRMRERTGLKRPYILAVGTIEPRKNLKFLVDVFERMGSDSALDGVDLVIAGMPGWRCDDILARFTDSSRADRIHYMRYVPDGMLMALYSGAAAFVVPSHYEGFGFPPLEAMACGTPVVSSNGGSLPEVLGEAAIVNTDFDEVNWLKSIDRAVNDSAAREQLIAAGVKQASQYRWERTAIETWQVYRDEIKPFV